MISELLVNGETAARPVGDIMREMKKWVDVSNESGWDPSEVDLPPEPLAGGSKDYEMGLGRAQRPEDWQRGLETAADQWQQPRGCHLKTVGKAAQREAGQRNERQPWETSCSG